MKKRPPSAADRLPLTARRSALWPLVEVGENNRFRFVTGPLVFVLVAALTVGWLARRRKTTRG